MPVNDKGDKVGEAFPLPESAQRAIFGDGAVHHKHLFDVTVTRVVGSVFSGGVIQPREAAFLIISEQEDGSFSFPLEDGRTVHVDVVTGDSPDGDN